MPARVRVRQPFILDAEAPIFGPASVEVNSAQDACFIPRSCRASCGCEIPRTCKKCFGKNCFQLDVAGRG